MRGRESEVADEEKAEEALAELSTALYAGVRYDGKTDEDDRLVRKARGEGGRGGGGGLTSKWWFWTIISVGAGVAVPVVLYEAGAFDSSASSTWPRRRHLRQRADPVLARCRDVARPCSMPTADHALVTVAAEMPPLVPISRANARFGRKTARFHLVATQDPVPESVFMSPFCFHRPGASRLRRAVPDRQRRRPAAPG